MSARFEDIVRGCTARAGRELHDGEIWSEPGLGGRGISFHLQLPGATVPSADDADEAASLATST